MKAPAFLSAVLIGTALCAPVAHAHDTHDRSDDVSKTYDLKGFDEISVAGVYILDVKVGPKFSIELSGDAKEMDKIEVYVRNDVLHLGNEKTRPKRKQNVNTHGIDAVITLPSLNGLSVAGVATGDIENVKSDEFEIKVSGVADVDIDGTCGTLDARVTGVGELDAEDLKCRNVDIKLSGVGEASVYASDSIEAKAGGVGQINVYGKPKNIDKTDNFLSKVRIR